MTDIAFPENNEDSLLAQAKKLGTTLDFVYEPKSFKTGGLLIQAAKSRDVDSARKLASKAKFVIASSTDENIIRRILEAKWIDYFTDIETSTGRDHTHYRRSNFNQVLAKLAKDTGKTYLVDFSRLLKIQNNKKLAVLLGRIMQNINICQKFKVPVAIATFAREPYELRNPRDLQAVLRSLKTRKISDIAQIIK